jgi:hypothetical protein
MDQDAEAAVNALQQLPAGLKKTATILAACNSSVDARHDLTIAARLVMMLPEGANREDAFVSYAERIAVFDPAAAVGLVKGQPDDHLKRTVLPNLLASLSGENLIDALQEIQKLNATGHEAMTFESLYFSDASDPETVADWAVRQPDKQQYVGAVAAAWVEVEPEKAKTWLGSLDVRTRDQALRYVVDRALSVVTADEADHFEQTAQWIPQITDPVARQAAANALAKDWVQREPVSGRAWLATAPLPEEVKRQFLDRPSVAR